jgi:hypothetical protein
MALKMPVACIEKVEAAQLEPGPPIFRGRGQVPPEEIDGQLAIAALLQRRCARCHGWINGTLSVKAARADTTDQGQRDRAPQ